MEHSATFKTDDTVVFANRELYPWYTVTWKKYGSIFIKIYVWLYICTRIVQKGRYQDDKSRYK